MAVTGVKQTHSDRMKLLDGLPACVPTYLPIYSTRALIARDRSLLHSSTAKASEPAAQEWQRKKIKTEIREATTKKRSNQSQYQYGFLMMMRAEGVEGPEK